MMACLISSYVAHCDAVSTAARACSQLTPKSACKHQCSGGTVEDVLNPDEFSQRLSRICRHTCLPNPLIHQPGLHCLFWVGAEKPYLVDLHFSCCAFILTYDCTAMQAAKKLQLLAQTDRIAGNVHPHDEQYRCPATYLKLTLCLIPVS